MSGGVLRSLVEAKHQPVGTIVQLPSPEVVELVGRAGYDFVVFDLEHGLYDLGLLPSLLRAAERSGLVPFVRLSGPDPIQAGRVLDFGASVLVIPGVGSRGEVHELVRASHYPQAGRRGACSAIRAAAYKAGPDYGTVANDATSIVLLIESAALLEAIDDVIALPGVDAVMPGPYDLSVSLDKRGQLDHPDVRAAIDRIKAAARAGGKLIGDYVRTREQVERVRGSTDFIVDGIDIHTIRDALIASRLNMST